jgi:hypothetical protein
VRWLPDGQPATLIEALRSAAPELATQPMVFDEAPDDLVPFLPEVVVGGDDPVLLATRLVPGTSLFAVADAVLATPRPAVLVHGDLHGDNQVWQGGRLRLVVDFETVSVAEPEYDLRAFPGPRLGPGLRLLTATVRHYERLTGRRLAFDRIMAWHLRQALGDVLWRSEAGLPMADQRTPPDWVDDLAARFRELALPAGPGPGDADDAATG